MIFFATDIPQLNKSKVQQPGILNRTNSHPKNDQTKENISYTSPSKLTFCERLIKKILQPKKKILIISCKMHFSLCKNIFYTSLKIFLMLVQKHQVFHTKITYYGC